MMKVTPKTYTWLKPLVTISSICLLITPLFILLKVIKNDDFFVKTWNAISIVILVLYICAVIAFSLYTFFRYQLQKVSQYKQTPKDKKILFLSFCLYFIGFLSCVIYLIAGLAIKTKTPDAYIAFGVTYFFILSGSIGGAILETLARIPEQIFLSQVEAREIQKLKEAKRTEIMKSQSKEKEIEATIKGQRTSAAQKFLTRDDSEHFSSNDDEFNPFE